MILEKKEIKETREILEQPVHRDQRVKPEAQARRVRKESEVRKVHRVQLERMETQSRLVLAMR